MTREDTKLMGGNTTKTMPVGADEPRWDGCAGKVRTCHDEPSERHSWHDHYEQPNYVVHKVGPWKLNTNCEEPGGEGDPHDL